MLRLLRKGGKLDDSDSDSQDADVLPQLHAAAVQGRVALGPTACSARGRARAFRDYLLGALKHFASNQARNANAGRRGGGRLVLNCALPILGIELTSIVGAPLHPAVALP